MTEAKDNSSLPLLLSITGAVLAVVGGGWYLLNQESTDHDPSADVASFEAPDAIAIEEPAIAEATTDELALDVDAELRKARLAADAEILVLPATQSALYYYGRVLQGDAQHAVAIAELDAILAKVEQTVRQHLVAEEYEAAYEIAVLVAEQEPEHALVIETQQTLDRYTEQLVDTAIEFAQSGADDQAAEALATAQALPGRNPEYFKAVQSSIDEIQTVRKNAEQDRKQRARLANNEAKAAWVDRIERAITQGNLISPAGASARDLLAERNSWAAERKAMTSKLLSSMVETAKVHVGNRDLADAEALVAAAVDISGSASGFEEIRSAIDDALIEAEKNRIAHMRELVQLKTAAPRYPRRAQEKGQTGWVDVYFTVTESGETADIEVNRSDPRAVFDSAAMDAVKKWAFEPIEYRGQIIHQRAAARLVFRLE